jgi:hypothetical protein
MSENMIRSLQESIKSLVDVVSEGFRSITSVVQPIRNIAEMMKKQSEMVEKGFADQIEATIQTSLLDKMAQIPGAGMRLRAHEERIDKRKNRFERERNAVLTRTEGFIEDEKRTAIKRLKEMDQPVLELLDLYGTTKVVDNYALFSLPTWELIHQHNHDNHFVRSWILDQKCKSVLDSIEALVKRREDFDRELEKVVQSDIGNRAFNLPFVDVDGKLAVSPVHVKGPEGTFAARAKAWTELLQKQFSDLETTSERDESKQVKAEFMEAYLAEISAAELSGEEQEFLESYIREGLEGDGILFHRAKL